MLLHLYLHDGNYGYEITTLVIKTVEITAKQTYDIIKEISYEAGIQGYKCIRSYE